MSIGLKHTVIHNYDRDKNTTIETPLNIDDNIKNIINTFVL
jgi:hypothetical protein